MPKGLYTQSVCVLTDGRATIAEVRRAVEAEGFPVVKEIDAAERWEFGGPGFLISYRPEINGAVVVDMIDRAWPDGMGDPKTDPGLFGAWSMGMFGPFTYPGGLKRASEPAWAWPGGKEAAASHRGVIRIRLTYAGGLPPDAPVIPKECDPLDEMAFLTRLVIAIGSARGTKCYFNPNGEVLRDFDGLRTMFQSAKQQNKEPILLWANARLFRMSPEFGFMDTVGNQQLNVPDIEVIYPVTGYQPEDIDYYMRNVTHHLLTIGREFQTGETIDGPNDRDLSWSIDVPEAPLVLPPRRVMRLFPSAEAGPIRQLLRGVP